LPGSPPILDEVQLTSYLIQTVELSEAIRASGVDPAVMQSALARSKPAERGSLRSVLNVVHSARHMKALRSGRSSEPPPRDFFWSQIRRGSPGIRAALEAAGINLRSLVFYLAHGKHEAHYTAVPADQTGRECGVEMLNDDFTGMEFVVAALSRYFGIARS